MRRVLSQRVAIFLLAAAHANSLFAAGGNGNLEQAITIEAVLSLLYCGILVAVAWGVNRFGSTSAKAWEPWLLAQAVSVNSTLLLPWCVALAHHLTVPYGTVDDTYDAPFAALTVAGWTLPMVHWLFRIRTNARLQTTLGSPFTRWVFTLAFLPLPVGLVHGVAFFLPVLSAAAILASEWLLFFRPDLIAHFSSTSLSPSPANRSH